MLIRIAAAILCPCLVSLDAAETSTRSPRLRVLSYNIHHAEGMDRELNLGRIAGVIGSVEPDIVSLQEVDQNVGRTSGVNQPEELARLTEMQVVFGGNITLQGGEYGNAVLTRLPVVRSQNRLLPVIRNGEQRGVLEVEVAWPTSDDALIFLATHLDHRRDDSERRASVAVINDLIESAGDRPALLAGDLNGVPDSRTLMELQRLWTSASSQPQPTIPVTTPLRQIDYILFRPAGRWAVVEARVLPEAVASDHRPVLSVLELLPLQRE